MNRTFSSSVFAGHFGLLVAFAPFANGAPIERNLAPPEPMREFRGVWIATVGNRNWPSRPGLPSAEQQAELRAIFDQVVRLNLNAVILQVRPSCDAFYASKLEPWSEYLTGQMGQAPNPFYDPLAFAIAEAHRRGLELHAWFNPYRARYSGAKSPVARNHISRAHPELIRHYGQFAWLDPGDAAVQQHTTAVILDVVQRYDIDGVHLDDYFYPYPQRVPGGKSPEFPDESTWRKYRANGGKLDRADWRRKNVDDLVQSLYRRIKAAKPWVKFGISPFGIWRPGYPKEITGTDAYAELYADARQWIASGWVDYLSPQLYWAIDAKGQSYPLLLKWWAGQNPQSRHLWPGNNCVKVGSGESEWKADEIVSQIRLTRNQPGASGNVLWNATSLTARNAALGSTLGKEVFSQPALVPSSPWLDHRAPGPVSLAVELASPHGNWVASWRSTGEESVWLWVLQSRIADRWTTEILPGSVKSRTFGPNGSSTLPERVALRAVDRCGNASLPVIETIGPTSPAAASDGKRRP